MIKLSNNRGQALVEFVIIVFPLITLLIAIEFMADAYLLKQRTIIGARYATWKMTNPGSAQSAVEKNVVKYFFPYSSGSTELKKINNQPSPGLGETFKDIFDRNLSGLYDRVLGFTHQVFTNSKNTPLTAEYSVNYYQSLNLPKGFPQQLTLSSSHEVDGNCWDGDNTDVHEIFGLMVSGAIEFVAKIFD